MRLLGIVTHNGAIVHDSPNIDICREFLRLRGLEFDPKKGHWVGPGKVGAIKPRPNGPGWVAGYAMVHSVKEVQS